MARGGMMRERQYLDRDVYELAKERVNHAFELFDTLGLAFSGGKDSTAVLNVALEVAHERGGKELPLRVVHFDEEAQTQDTVDYVRRVSQRDDVAFEWYCLPVAHQNACSRANPYWYPWDPDCPDKWVSDLPPEAITGAADCYTQAGIPPERQLDFFPLQPPEHRWTVPECTGWLWPANRYGQVGFMLGIRAAESLTRYRAVVRRDVENWIIPFSGSPTGARNSPVSPPTSRNVNKVYPIYDWTTTDVWVAPSKLGWDYNRTYDKMSMHGVTPEAQRVAPPWHPEAIGSLGFYPAAFPEMWARMVDRVEGVGTAYRYAKTELYGFGKRSFTKADHLTWEEFIAETLRRHGPEMRTIMARRIKEEIRNHHRVTPDPILEQVHHPDTGICWRFLYTLASRGDPMNRKIPRMYQGERRAEQRRRYEAERQRMIEAGRLDPRRRSGSIRVSDEMVAAGDTLTTPDDEHLKIGDL
jgi:predicted phosphoadenosine phosphosulfate sulfurtransferase